MFSQTQSSDSARSQSTGPSRVRLTPALDIVAGPERYEARLAVPGVREADVNLRFEAGLLTVEAAQSTAAVGDGQRLLHREWQPGVFVRSLRLGDDVDATGIKATLKHGILTVTLPKRESAKPRKISVSVG